MNPCSLPRFAICPRSPRNEICGQTLTPADRFALTSSGSLGRPVTDTSPNATSRSRRADSLEITDRLLAGILNRHMSRAGGLGPLEDDPHERRGRPLLARVAG
jgi:hypothetical protein